MFFLQAVCFSFVSLSVLAAPVPVRKQLSARSSSSPFAADPSINVAGIYAAAKAATSKSLDSFPPRQGKKSDVHIYGDWQDLKDVSAFHFIADMDVDCDGVDADCAGNSGGDRHTSFGQLDASKVPYFVIPLRFTNSQKDKLKSNALGAIICGGKMFYAIYGDQNGASHEVIGEGSLLLAKTCFPDAKISGNNGHDQSDVAYIVFGDKVPTGVKDTTIDISALKKLGDEQVKLLQSALGIK
ncbi:fungal chitosanase of glycosyl hydrolase group 75-domain-containing protein [Mycena floridula]|nr:fungal chitosanase of glycosyl hydrolase group 75-domain-containing protein [Mycena floridula]